MTIFINNKKETFEHEKLSVADLIRIKNYTFNLLVTKINGKTVKKDERENAFVTEGDDVLILHMISGG